MGNGLFEILKYIALEIHMEGKTLPSLKISITGIAS
jgi:hypothetical protein